MFALIFSVIFVGEEVTVFGFVRGVYEKNLENHWFAQKLSLDSNYCLNFRVVILHCISQII